MGNSTEKSDVFAAGASPVVNLGIGGNERDAEEQMEKKKENFDDKCKNREWSLCSEFRTEPSIDGDPAKKKDEPTTPPCTPQVGSIAALRTIWARNISRSIDKSHLIDFFKDAGEIVDVRLPTECRTRCHIEFATEEAAGKAVNFNPRELLGRPVILGLIPATISVRGFDTSSGFDRILTFLREHFSTFGDIYWIFIASDNHYGPPNGLAFVGYCYPQVLPKALAMNGHKFGDSPLTIEDATPLLLQNNIRGCGPEFFRRRQFGPYRGTCYRGTYRSKRGYGGEGIGEVGSPFSPPPGFFEFVNAHRSEFRTEPSIGGAAAAPAKKKYEPTTPPCTPQVGSIAALRTIWARNLSHSIDKSHLIDFFKDAGEIVDVRFPTECRTRCHIEFATEEAAGKAVNFNHRELLGRPVILGLIPATISVRGFDTSSGSDQILTFFREQFSTFGDICWIFIARDYHNGPPNGLAFVGYRYPQALPKALAMNGHKFGDFLLTIEDATPLLLQSNMKGLRPGFFRRRQFGPYRGTCYRESYRAKRGYGGAGIGKAGSPYNPPSGKKIKLDDD